MLMYPTTTEMKLRAWEHREKFMTVGRTGQIHTEVVSEKHRVSAQLGWGEVMPLEGAA